MDELKNLFKKLNISLTCFIALFSTMLGALLNDIGNSKPAYMIGYDHVVTMVLFMVGPFVLGWMAGKENNN